MINIHQASDIIQTYLLTPQTEKVSVTNALNRILAQDYFAPCDVPFFNQSAVDGFLINTKYFQCDKQWKTAGEIKAGDNLEITDNHINENTVFKIFTGAKVPDGFDAIIMKEYAVTDESSGKVEFKTDKIKAFQNIRMKGEEAKKGEKIFSKGTVLQPEHIAVMASLGTQKIEVYKKFSIQIIVTGNELQTIDKPNIKEGEKYESNGIMLKCLLKKYFDTDAEVLVVPDNPDEIYSALKQAVDKNDIIITTGGVSVGDYDYTKTIIRRLGFEIKFDKVAQKPGKPFVFAIKQNKIIFGLPGNPRAVLTCFYWYILRYLLKCYQTGKEWIHPVIQLEMEEDYLFNDNRSRILFVRTENNRVVIPDKQDSHMLITSAHSDAMVVIDKSIYKNEKINVYLLK